MTLSFIILFAVMAAVTIFFIYRKSNRPYVISKTITSILFLVIALISHFRGESGTAEFITVFLGFIFCLGGDVFLAFANETGGHPRQPFFTLGVGSFLIAHLFFCWHLLKVADFRIRPPVIMAAVAFIIVVITSRSDAYDYGGNKIPCMIYSIFIGLLCGLGIDLLILKGFGGGYLVLALGSVLFFLSDLILSVKFFKKSFPAWVPAGVLVTYYSATLLIAFSLRFALA